MTIVNGGSAISSFDLHALHQLPRKYETASLDSVAHYVKNMNKQICRGVAT
jgi:hypothetical protein